ncbi:MAG: hypothetical protein SFZ24_08280 [Planctomycetota bacterium]|nr:hypothetical protein [Planctomycetota bacterium]
MSTTRRWLKFLVLTLAALVAFAAPAFALDKVTLKGNRVLEGTITKEGEGFIWFEYMIGQMKHTELITSDQIVKIERDAAATTATTAAPAPTAATTGGSTPAAPAAEPVKQEPAAPATGSSPGATRIAFISLEDTVGSHLNADALKHSVELIEGEKPDIIVLVFFSPGGALAEVQPLSDYIHEEMKKKYRVVGWIRSAISAASLTAFNLEELYMMKEGNIGGTVAYIPGAGGGGNKAISGADLERVLKMGEEISKRGKRNPLIMRAMQVFMDLSCDIDSDGVITWREDTEGQYVVNTEDRILTLNSDSALKFGVSKGTADTKQELARLMGVPEWVEVGPKADQYQQEFRENVHDAQTRAGELMAKLEMAMRAAESSGGDPKERNLYVGRARRVLDEMQSLIRQAPSLEKYSQFNKDFFEAMRKRLKEMTAVPERR